MVRGHTTDPLASLLEAGGRVIYVKGAPDRLLPMCASQLKGAGLSQVNAMRSSDLSPVDPQFWLQAQEELSSQGLRVLALCR